MLVNLILFSILRSIVVTKRMNDLESNYIDILQKLTSNEMSSFWFLEKCRLIFSKTEKQITITLWLWDRKEFVFVFGIICWCVTVAFFFFFQMRVVHQSSSPKRCYQSEQPSEQIFVNLLPNEMFYRKVEVVRNRWNSG